MDGCISINTEKFDRATLLLAQMKDLSGLLIDQLSGTVAGQEFGEALTLATVINEKAEETGGLLVQE